MDRRKWHIDKSVPLSTILTVIGMITAVAGLYASFSTDLAILKQAQSTTSTQLTQVLANQQRIDAEQNAEIKEIRRDTREAYERIDTKMDTLLSRGQR